MEGAVVDCIGTEPLDIDPLAVNPRQRPGLRIFRSWSPGRPTVYDWVLQPESSSAERLRTICHASCPVSVVLGH